MSEDSAAQPVRHTVQLASEHAGIQRAVDETRSFVEEHLSDEDLAYRAVLVVSEAVTNAVEHGNEYDQMKKVRLELLWDQSAITISVEDEGSGFDPDTAIDPCAPENLTHEEGRGLFLIRRMSEEVQYEKEGAHLRATLRPSRGADS